MERNDDEAIADSVKVILLLHSLILSFGGIPLLYYGDELGTLNDDSYLNDPHKKEDSRWVHRPLIDWDKAERRNTTGTVEYAIFSALKRMISVRKEIDVFADFNNRELIDVENEHLFVYERFDINRHSERVLVVANFDAKPQHLNLDDVSGWGNLQYAQLIDLYTGQRPDVFKKALIVPPFSFYWLQER